MRTGTNKALVITSPAPLPAPGGRPVIFLAGSIDQGNAPDWQITVIEALADCPVTLLNPRRAVWEEAASDTFRTQVEWELDAMERADGIALCLAPGSLAPVSLLELGLHAASGKLTLCCPEGFWRKGNVEIVARHYGIPQHPDLAALIADLRQRYG